MEYKNFHTIHKQQLCRSSAPEAHSAYTLTSLSYTRVSIQPADKPTEMHKLSLKLDMKTEAVNGYPNKKKGEKRTKKKIHHLHKQSERHEGWAELTGSDNAKKLGHI